MRLLSVAIIMGVSAFAGPAMAAKADYCAAYARDFADAKASAKPLWQHKYDIALVACMAEPEKVANAKPVIPKVQPAKIQTAKTEPALVIPPEPVAVEKIAKPLAKSAEWNDYCAKKYNSFNIKTGTYKSLTGVERKCLVN